MGSFDEIFEIDRRLRTGKLESQLATLKQLPSLVLSLHSDPIGLGTLLVRLADFFLSARNELRVCVVRALKACVPHIQDLPGHGEEIVRRLGVLWDSNDVYARSLVVKVYGYLARGLANCNGAIYRIHQSLLSPHEEEHEAAVLAALAFLKAKPQCLRQFADALLRLWRQLPRESFLRPLLLEAFDRESECATTELSIYHHLARDLNNFEPQQVEQIITLLTKICIRTGFLISDHQILLNHYDSHAQVDEIKALFG